MSAKKKKEVDVDADDVEITTAERKELRVLCANLRDDRLRGLLFKLLDATDDGSDSESED